jgi:hypothetical protein
LIVGTIEDEEDGEEEGVEDAEELQQQSIAAEHELAAVEDQQGELESMRDLPSGRVCEWPTPVLLNNECFECRGTMVDMPELALPPDVPEQEPDELYENVRAWVQRIGVVTTRIVTWNLMAKDPPSAQEMRRVLLPLNKVRLATATVEGVNARSVSRICYWNRGVRAIHRFFDDKCVQEGLGSESERCVRPSLPPDLLVRFFAFIAHDLLRGSDCA